MAAKGKGAVSWEQKMERLRRRSLPERVLRICDDAARRTEYDEAKRAADRARLLAESDADNGVFAERARLAAERCESAREALDRASVCLTFRALPRPVLEELIHAHPPTDEQAADGAAFNPDTFPAALIAASSTDGMSEAEARELLDSWSAPDANALWEAAWEVQQEGRADKAADLGKG
ncbi:hypothetical protein DDQ41_12430 [Streptomyces spongiicola]|uniref:Uncharacterized protein n=1 Tax=Streptomyces spongiicola TaxID=1690221 RepID=A0ABN5KMN3_9ACTN|nr:hypothetical protein [Streptomyces spongiicola]AWK09594.1 hypothetical protein DDQ41_12430 [Streptomyces spongiicola]